MLNIKALDLKNIHIFKNISVEFDKPLTYVRGLNLDSNKRKPTSNGAGKTLLFSTILSILRENIPNSLKRRDPKALFGKKDSQIGLFVTKRSDEYEILQTALKYNIYKNGKDQQIRTKEIARSYIENLCPLNDAAVYTTVFLTTQKQHPIQNVSDSERLSTFVSLFNLNQYEVLRQHFAKKLGAIRDNEIKLSVLEQQRLKTTKVYEELKENSKEVDIELVEKAISMEKKYRNKFDETNILLAELNQQLKLFDQLLSIEKKLDKLRKVYVYKKAPDIVLTQLKNKIDLLKDWDKYNREYSFYLSRKKEISRHIVGDLNLDKLKNYYNDVKENFESLYKEKMIQEEKRKEFMRTRNELKEINKELGELKRSSNFDEVLEVVKDSTMEELLKEKVQIENILQLKSLLHKHINGKCPTCKNEIDIAVIQKLVNNAKKNAHFIETVIRVKSLLDKKSNLNKEFDHKAHENLLNRYDECKTTLKNLEKQIEQSRQNESLKRELRSLRKPEEPDQKCNDSLENINNDIKLCENVLELLSEKSALAKIAKKVLPKSVIEIEKLFSKLKQQVETAEKLKIVYGNKLAKYSTIITRHNQYSQIKEVYEKELVELDRSISILKQRSQKKRTYELLVKAYGSKGLRAIAVNKICGLVEQNLNYYSPIVFAEPFSFTVATDETGVSILCKRNKHPDSISDVRTLSGAESNNFRLLCLISLLPLIPNDRRVNLLILDEPTSHMDEVSRERFNENLIPLLKEIVPNIFIITPHKDDVRSDASEWVVVKENGFSKIEVN